MPILYVSGGGQDGDWLAPRPVPPGVLGTACEGAAAHRCEMVITCGHGDQAFAEDIVTITAPDTEA
jgi:hypothetical protein